MTATDCVHVFVCVNKKTKGKCCASFHAEKAFEYLRKAFNQKRHLIQDTRRIKVVETSCLGQCAIGPNIYIAPDNIWYTFSSVDELDELVEKHFISGEIVSKLINNGIHHDSLPEFT